MAERTGIPKQTFDQKLLRTGASVPGFDAPCAFSTGLGVLLYWRVFGPVVAGAGVELFAHKTAHDALNSFSETLKAHYLEGRRCIIAPQSTLNLTPEEWAADCGMRAGEHVKALMASGTAKEDCLIWRHQSHERVAELLQQ